MKDRTKTPHFVSNAQYSENISKTIDGLKKRRKAEKDSVTGQAALSPWEADRSRPPPAPAPKDPAAQVFCNPNRESSSRILGKTPASQDGGRLSSSLLSRRKKLKAPIGWIIGLNCRFLYCQYHCGQRIAPANHGYRFAHNKNARRQFEGSGRARRRPLPLSGIVPLGRIPNGTILRKRRTAT